ncbi:hypothetical protein AVEN_144079-1 [Araneus ventricosus]|uniref:Tc1-like transposase DDE domain-containing protein n=1 Tax=Araneus ventricosus TaxID=182803 RepID=A0A4Y2E711_ARAVE|nr:hypothetical protein AVEN_144079-1 [Araneus ventricosus]
MGHLQVSECELFNGPSLIWALRAEGPLVYRCSLHGTMLYASPGPDNTTIALLMIGNTLPGLTSLVSNCIGRMHAYEYGDNINNPYWINHPVCQQGAVQSGGASVMRVATKWLQEHSSDFRHFHWPPKSSGMNIIEDIWDALLHVVEKRSPPPSTSMDLLTVLQDSWCGFPPGYLPTLFESFPHRSASLLRAHGGQTRY